MFYTVYLLAFSVLFGAAVGSFINVVVYRLPKGSFLSKTRSYCPACEKKLANLDLIPIISFFILKGRCRYCGVKIPARYPLVEAACAGLAVLCLQRFVLSSPYLVFDFRYPISFGVSAVLLAISLIDFDTKEIPHSLIIAVIPFAAAAIWVFGDVSLFERAAGFFAVSLPMFLLTIIIPDAFGGGDIKLIAVCGFLLGWKNTLLAFFISLLLGGGYAIYLLISRKSKAGAHIAFGPYLCFGVITALLWGSDIIRWYLSMFNM